MHMYVVTGQYRYDRWMEGADLTDDKQVCYNEKWTKNDTKQRR